MRENTSKGSHSDRRAEVAAQAGGSALSVNGSYSHSSGLSRSQRFNDSRDSPRVPHVLASRTGLRSLRDTPLGAQHLSKSSRERSGTSLAHFEAVADGHSLLHDRCSNEDPVSSFWAWRCLRLQHDRRSNVRSRRVESPGALDGRGNSPDVVRQVPDDGQICWGHPTH